MSLVNTILRWALPAAFVILAELMVLFKAAPAVVAGAVLVAFAEALRSQRPWHGKVFVFSLVGATFLALFWSTFWTGQLFILAACAGMLLVTGRWIPRAIGPEEAVRLPAFFYLFLVFLNFYIFQSQAPFFYGLMYLGSTAAVFVGVRNLLTEHLTALVMTFIAGQFMFLFHFLPHGYVTLAAVSTIAAHALGRAVKVRQEGVGAFLKEITALAAIAVTLFAVSGIRPR